MASPSPLSAGFLDPVMESQATFRILLEAMSRPARRQTLRGLADPPSPLYPTTAALALTLLDRDTPLWLDPALADAQAVRGWLAFHSGAPLVAETARASFALASDPLSLPRLESFAQGEERYPDRSTTLILQVEAFEAAGPLFSGPGVGEPLRLGARPLPADFWAQLRANAARFPCGVDLVLASPEEIAALPRSLLVGAS